MAAAAAGGVVSLSARVAATRHDTIRRGWREVGRAVAREAAAVEAAAATLPEMAARVSRCGLMGF